jgi:hypothetical protein
MQQLFITSHLSAREWVGFIVYLATVLLILLKEECLSCKINRVKGNKI